MEQIKIISDGTPQGTKVLNHDGNSIPGITSIKTSINVNSLCTAVIQFTNVMMSLNAVMVNERETILVTGNSLWELHPLKQWANRKTGKI